MRDTEKLEILATLIGVPFKDLLKRAGISGTPEAGAGLAVPTAEIITPLRTIFKWTADNPQPIPGDATLWWIFGTGSLMTPYEVAKQWKGLNPPIPILVTGGIGGGTRTLRQLKEGNDLPDTPFATRVFDRVNQNLDTLRELFVNDKTSDKSKFWEYMLYRYDIERGYDNRKFDGLSGQLSVAERFKFNSWEKKVFRDFPFTPEE